MRNEHTDIVAGIMLLRKYMSAMSLNCCASGIFLEMPSPRAKHARTTYNSK